MPKSLKVVPVCGPPSSGKGYFLKKLMENIPAGLNVSIIGVGDMLRRRRLVDDEIGRQVAELMSHRKLIPDEVTWVLFKDQFYLTTSVETDLVFLDGFPRSLVQANYLCSLVSYTDVAVIEISASLELCLRLVARRAGEKRVDDDPEKIAVGYQRYVNFEFPAIKTLISGNTGAHLNINRENRPSDWCISTEVPRVWKHLQEKVL